MSPENLPAANDRPYWMYLLECEGGSYYCGIALNVERRFQEHLDGKGAAYTRSHRPIRVLSSMQFPDRSAALKAEYALKQLPRTAKREFFEPSRIADNEDRDRRAQGSNRMR